MKLEKFLGSKTKADILKYLIFRRQGISIRALESELSWSFPAIKKQVDSLEEAEIIDIDKDNMKRSISIKPDILEYIKSIFMYSIKSDLKKFFEQHSFSIDKYFLGKVFGNALDIDLIVIYKGGEKELLEAIKEEINNLFRGYCIENISVVFMSSDDFARRYRLADKFVLSLMRLTN